MPTESKKELMHTLQCGSCTFIEREKIFERKCSELGKLPSSKSCPHHTSNAFSLINNEDDTNALKSLSHLMAHYSPNDLSALASLMLKEKQTRRMGMHFFQKVYVRLQGQVKSNYFSNFVVGHIIDASKERVRIIGFNGKHVVCVYAIMEADSSTFYTLERFEPIRQQMIEAKRFRDPEVCHDVIGKATAKISSLARADFDEIMSTSVAKRRLKRADKDDLVSLVTRMSKGHLKLKVAKDEEIRII